MFDCTAQVEILFKSYQEAYTICAIPVVRSNSDVGIDMLEDFIEPAELYTDQQLNDIRDVAGFELPSSYCNFLKTYGNAFVGGLVDSSSDHPILSFFPAVTVISTFNFNSLFKEHRMIPIADCELGNAWVLDENGRIHYVNFYNGSAVITKVAPSFSDFKSRIAVEDE